jgi:hypothetical protein
LNYIRRTTKPPVRGLPGRTGVFLCAQVKISCSEFRGTESAPVRRIRMTRFMLNLILKLTLLGFAASLSSGVQAQPKAGTTHEQPD